MGAPSCPPSVEMVTQRDLAALESLERAAASLREAIEVKIMGGARIEAGPLRFSTAMRQAR